MRSKIVLFSIVAGACFFGASCSGSANNDRGNRAQGNNSAANQAPPPGSPSPTPTAENQEEFVRKAVTELGEALAKGDADALDKIYSDGYIHVADNGQLSTKADLLVGIRSGAIKFTSVNFEEISVRTYGESAVALATFLATSVVDGREVYINDRITLVAVKDNDTWRFVSSQMTPVKAASSGENTKNPAGSNPAPGGGKSSSQGPTANPGQQSTSSGNK